MVDDYSYTDAPGGHKTTLAGTERFGATSDPTGTPTDVYITPADIATYLAGLYVSTAIDGMKLQWDSATSITVLTGRCFAENGDEIKAASDITKSSLSLSASTWYHVYAYLDTGTPAAEVVTTAPAAWKNSAYSKTSDTSRRYLGSIRTDGSSNVFAFKHHPHSNMLIYSNDVDTKATPHLTLNNGTASTATAVDCSAVIPTTSRIGIIRAANTADQIVDMGETTNVTNARLNVGNAAHQNAVISLPLTSSQTFYYKFAAGPSGTGLYINVYGYYFDR